MAEALAYLRDIDLTGHARHLWDLIETIDPCFGGLVVAVLVCVGHKMASGHRTLYGLGLRLGVLTFLLHGTWAIVRNGGWQDLSLTVQASRSGLIAGIVLAVAWITFPTLFFVYRYFRVALTAFLVYCGYALVTAPTLEQGILPGIALRGLLVAALAMVVAWILQPVWDLVVPRWKSAPPAPVSEEKKETPGQQLAETDRLARRERKRWRKLVLMFTRPASHLLIGAPAEDPFLGSCEMRRRRDKARLTAELTYVMAMPEIAVQFPRDMFENWVNRYLGDHLPPEEVEENGLNLQMILARYQKRQQSSGTFMNLEDLHHWFAEEQKRIQALPLDQTSRQNKLLDLQELFLSMSQRFLGETPPAIVPMVGRKEFGLVREKGALSELPPAKAE